MSSSINIYPFEDMEGLIRFGIQTTIFIMGVLIAYFLIIKPALHLHNERKKRTSGRETLAQKELEKAKALEEQYESGLLEGINNARHMRSVELKKAQEEANKILAIANQNSASYLAEIKAKVSEQNTLAKKQLPQHIDEILDTVFKKLSSLAVFIFCDLFFYQIQHACNSASTPIPQIKSQ
ncbi:MAG: hypothetical protein K2X39_08555 [Silvanigrellaceae bacterium]|nr:hypothetical protein [Silvanigrellaceae bacterium]